MATIAQLVEAGVLRAYRPRLLRPGDMIEAQVLCLGAAWDFLEHPMPGVRAAHYIASIDVLHAQLGHFVLGRGAGHFLTLGSAREAIGKFSAGKLRLAGWRQADDVIIACFGYHRDGVAELGGYAAIKRRIFEDRGQLGLGDHYGRARS